MQEAQTVRLVGGISTRLSPAIGKPSADVRMQRLLEHVKATVSWAALRCCCRVCSNLRAFMGTRLGTSAVDLNVFAMPHKTL